MKDKEGPAYFCWKNHEKEKFGCGKKWNPEEQPKTNAPPDDRRPVEPTRPPAPPKAEEAKVSEGLRDLLKAIGCKSNEEADAVIRLCTSGQHDLDGAKHGHSETCRIAIEMTLAMHMKECGERSKALEVVYSDAMSAVEK